MDIAIAILNWNGKHWLEKFLPTVLLHSSAATVYVIDNASTDDSVSYLTQNFPTVRIIQNKENFGFAKGYNEGLKTLNHEVFCLLNSDVEVTPNWLIAVAEIFVKMPEVAAVQPKILDYNRRNYFEFAGAAGGLIDNLGFPYCRGRIFGNIEEDLGQYDDEGEIFWASGCSLFIRSKDFWDLGGFDERFFAHQEEIDLCWRLKNQGRVIYYTSKSTVYHVGGGTLGVENPRKTYFNFRNNLTMLLKNLPASKVFWVLFLRLSLDGFAAFHLGFKNGYRHFWAILHAHYSFYMMLPGTLRRRPKSTISQYYQAKWLVFKNYF